MRLSIVLAALMALVFSSDADAFGRRKRKGKSHQQASCCTTTTTVASCSTCAGPAAGYSLPQTDQSGTIIPGAVPPGIQAQPGQIQQAPAPGQIRQQRPQQVIPPVPGQI